MMKFRVARVNPPYHQTSSVCIRSQCSPHPWKPRPRRSRPVHCQVGLPSGRSLGRECSETRAVYMVHLGRPAQAWHVS